MDMKGILYKIVIALIGVWVFAIGLITVCQASQPIQKYGILGKTSPELTTEYWVNEKSEPVKKVSLLDYKGKVICLLFFQDW